jgi:hypothetical protein
MLPVVLLIIAGSATVITVIATVISLQRERRSIAARSNTPIKRETLSSATQDIVTAMPNVAIASSSGSVNIAVDTSR